MITFITGNKGKFSEVQQILGDKLVMCDIDLPEVQTLDVREVVEAKLIEARKHVREGSIMVDDTGYYFESLGRLPGVFSKFFLKELGLSGIASLVSKLESSKAKVYTCIGYMDENNVVEYFTAEVSGTIVSPRGESGFGFDPLFMPDGFSTTVAEMDESTYKDVKSRAKAVEMLNEYLEHKA